MQGEIRSMYDTWKKMIDRCTNPRSRYWKCYGGRGIKVCRRWSKSFNSFCRDMGMRPTGMWLDRWPDPNGDYRPANCRWATPKQQQRNKRNNHVLTFKGRTMPIADWADELNVSMYTLFARIYKGWSVEETLTIPVIEGSVIRRSLWKHVTNKHRPDLRAARKQVAEECKRRYMLNRMKRKDAAGECRRCQSQVVMGRKLCQRHLDESNAYNSCWRHAHGLNLGKRGRPRKAVA